MLQCNFLSQHINLLHCLFQALPHYAIRFFKKFSMSLFVSYPVVQPDNLVIVLLHLLDSAHNHILVWSDFILQLGFTYRPIYTTCYYMICWQNDYVQKKKFISRRQNLLNTCWRDTRLLSRPCNREVGAPHFVGGRLDFHSKHFYLFLDLQNVYPGALPLNSFLLSPQKSKYSYHNVHPNCMLVEPSQ